MSLFHAQYYSEALQKQSGMFVILPDRAGPHRVVYLLHGLSDDYTIWQRRTSIERYADARGLAIVMPDGGRSFYLNLPYGNYEDHILGTVRFVDRTFPTVDAPEGRGIGGLSMGGYGSMKLALKYPELFGSVWSHSGVLNLRSSVKRYSNLTIKAEDDCFRLAKRPGRKPAIAFDCGTDDHLIEDNREFDAHLAQLGIPHVYREYPGGHTWEYWDQHIVEALDFHLKAMAVEGA